MFVDVSDSNHQKVEEGEAVDDNTKRDLIDILKAVIQGEGFTTKQFQTADRILWELEYGEEAEKPW